MAKYLSYDGLTYLWTKIKEALARKQDTGNYVTYSSNADITAGKKTGTTYTYGQSPMVVSNGIIIGGTAQNAGLVTRGISGATAPDTETGACASELLYINYDGDNVYGRSMVLGAGSSGTAITTTTASSTTAKNVYGTTYAAVRGDQMVNYVTAKLAESGGSSAEISETTLETSKWSSGQYSFESTYPASMYDLEVVVNSTATLAQLTAYKNAMLVGSATANVLTAKGIVPTVDIPVILKAVKK